MNKLKIIVCLIVLALITGCGKKNYITCSLNINNDLENYSVKSDYKIYFKGDFVTKIEKSEKYTSNDIDKLKLLDEMKSLEYYNLNDKYGGVTYNIKSSERNVIIKSTIIFETFDVNKMAKNGEIDKDYVKNGKIAVNGLKRIYEMKGLVCRG